MTNAIPQGFLT